LRICVLVAAVVTLAAVALVLVASRLPERPALGAALRTNGQLVERQEALRTAARDLSEQVCRRIEQGLPMDWPDGSGGHAPPCPRPPSRDAATEEFIARLSEQGALLEALATGPASEAHLALDGR
jgi:hypothetical protein